MHYYRLSAECTARDTLCIPRLSAECTAKDTLCIPIVSALSVRQARHSSFAVAIATEMLSVEQVKLETYRDVCLPALR